MVQWRHIAASSLPASLVKENHLSEPSSPMFVDLDPRTGRTSPTTHESMRTSFLGAHPVSERVHDPVRRELSEAVDLFALSYGQANSGNDRLYNRLTDDAFMAAMRALELALRDRLGRGPSANLAQLIDQGIERGLLPNVGHPKLFWRMLRQTRNAVAHGQGERYIGGMFLGQAIGVLIFVINGMYEPSSQPGDAD